MSLEAKEKLYAKLTALADGTREKSGATDKLSIDEMTEEVLALEVVSNEEETVADNEMKMWVSLTEDTLSPMIYIGGGDGTLLIDWGDGETTTAKVTTGLQIHHDYLKAGDYVISLTAIGSTKIRFTSSNGSGYGCGLFCFSWSSDYRNYTYSACVKKIIFSKIFPFDSTYSSSSFNRCVNLKTVILPDTMIKLPSGIFTYCYSLKNVVLPQNITTVDSGAFQYCYALNHVTLPKSLSQMASSFFYQCNSLTTAELPESITDIGAYAFYYCETLSKLVIPKNVKNIGSSAFGYCRAVRVYDFTSHESVPTLSSTNAFNGISTFCVIRVPAALYDEWIAATNWSAYADYIIAV